MRFFFVPNSSAVLGPYCSMQCGRSNVAVRPVDLIRQPA